jgi:hypothetical protein
MMQVAGTRIRMNKVVRFFMGWFLIALGIVGLVFPVMPGWIFLASGIIMLAGDVPLFARWICRVENRFPRARKLFLRIHDKINTDRPRPACSPEKMNEK